MCPSLTTESFLDKTTSKGSACFDVLLVFKVIPYFYTMLFFNHQTSMAMAMTFLYNISHYKSTISNSVNSGHELNTGMNLRTYIF